jgi:hypothetical protein
MHREDFCWFKMRNNIQKIEKINDLLVAPLQTSESPVTPNNATFIKVSF